MIDLFLASTILILGDSHSVGPFGWRLDEQLRMKGHRLATYASCGSIAKWWTVTSQSTTCGYYSNDLNNVITRSKTHPTPKLSLLLATVKPDLVIVQLGSNYVNYEDDTFVAADLKKLASEIKKTGAECFWISPPDMRLYRHQMPRLDLLIQEAVGDDCRLFDSKTATSYPETGGDGVHYWFSEGTAIANQWADAISQNF